MIYYRVTDELMYHVFSHAMVESLETSRSGGILVARSRGGGNSERRVAGNQRIRAGKERGGGKNDGERN